MKLIIKIALLIVVLLILFYTFFHTPPVNSNPIESITNQADPINQVFKDKTNLKSKNQKNSKSSASSQSIPTQIDDKSKIVLTDYITAFRDWQYFENCYTDIEDFANKKDPLDTLSERFTDNHRESQNQPTPQQNYYYQHHVDLCKTLINEVGEKNDNYYQIRQKLNSRFLSINAITDEEKQLEHALQMIKQLNSYKLELSKAYLPQSNLSLPESNQIHNRIESLTIEMMRVYEGNNPLQPEQIKLIEQYSEKIEGLQKVITESKQINKLQIDKITWIIDGYLNTMDDYLQKVQSADAFILMATQLYKSEYFQKETTVLKKLQAHTSIHDIYYLSMLNKVTIPLVACSMNYPCDAESDLILSYCLGLKDSMFNQACGTNLEEFYFNYYIGKNQLIDVSNYFNYLVNRYAN